MYEEEEENLEHKEQDTICPLCGLRQYGNICANCGIKIKEEEEDRKKEDDDDEYDWRERR
jgi:hypothetical protein